MSFKALVIEEKEGKYIRIIKNKDIEELPPGDLLIKVNYTSLNYKDALSAIGNKGVTRNYPHTPGIDAAGIIEKSKNPDFKEGEKVIVTSYDLGMGTSGGFGQYIRVPSEWAIKLPDGLTMKEAMILGTAGLTAGISVLRLSEIIKPEHGNVVVSGSTGGVGSLSVAILAKLGYDVVAITGKAQEKEFLTQIGAKDIILRKDIESKEPRPLLKGQFAGGIDTVGGPILENIIKSTTNMGVVVCTGNVASPEIGLTVFPFILRGVSLLGVGTQEHPMNERKMVWNKLANEWKPMQLMEMYNAIKLEELSHAIDLILKGQLRGRTIINLES